MVRVRSAKCFVYFLNFAFMKPQFALIARYEIIISYIKFSGVFLSSAKTFPNNETVTVNCVR